MNKVRILSFCRLDNEDVRFIRKQNGFDEETEQLKKTVAQLQEQIKAMQDVMRQQHNDIIYMKDIIKQLRTTDIQNYRVLVNSDFTLTIKKYIGNDINVVIPEQIDGKKVTHIGNIENLFYIAKASKIVVGAFMECSKILRITIPYGVTEIGDRTFSYCSSLISVTIPESVTEIGHYVFEECTNLKKIIFKGRIDFNGVKFDEDWKYGCNARIVFEP